MVGEGSRINPNQQHQVQFDFHISFKCRTYTVINGHNPDQDKPNPQYARQVATTMHRGNRVSRPSLVVRLHQVHP